MRPASSVLRVLIHLAGALALAGCAHIQVSMGTPTRIPTATRLATPTPVECQARNLLGCSSSIPIYVNGQSDLTAVLSPGGDLEVVFENRQNGSGVAFAFKPALDVRGFNSLQIRGVCDRESVFILEYKVQTEGGLALAATSSPQVFPAGGEPVTVSVPIVYDGAISEMAVNFVQTGDAARLTIESIYLSQ